MNNHDFDNKKIYRKPVDSCPLCRSNYIEKYHIINSYKLTFKVDRCIPCGFIFTNPGLNKDLLLKLYSREYYSGEADYSYHDERKIKKFARYVYDKRINIMNKFIEKGNFLDIGSSFGGLLESAKLYYEPYGIEISKLASDYAINDLNFNIHHGTLDDHPFDYDFFSIITMIELIEHLSDPVKALSECYKLLKTSGLLLIQTANMDGLQAKMLNKNYAYYMPGHLSYFSKKNLVELLKKTGFKKIKVFHPVEFGLLPKLKKTHSNFYRKWPKIIFYHYLGKIHYKNFAATSSMVIYAFK